MREDLVASVRTRQMLITEAAPIESRRLSKINHLMKDQSFTDMSYKVLKYANTIESASM
jgi:hypothetical protein